MAASDTDTTPLEEYHRRRNEEKKEQADVDIPVESSDRVQVTSISGVHDWMLESVDGYPSEGTVDRVDYLTEGCRNLGCQAVVRVRFTEAECPAVYNGTTEIYPIGGTRDTWDDAPIAAVKQEGDD